MLRLTRTQMLLATAIGCGVVATKIVRRRNPGPSFAGKTVLITGGSRGLGLELARRFGEEGANLAICARHDKSLGSAEIELRAAGYPVFATLCDVTSQDQVSQWVERVVERFGAIDVVVNNAGIIQAGPARTMTLNDYHRAMNTNFWGALHTIEAALPFFRGQQAGKIVNIASVGGEISVPHLLPYSCSKFALVALSEGLHAELWDEGIRVTTICPGLMRTGSPRNAEFKGLHRAEYAWFSISDSLPIVSMNAERAAQQIVEAARRGQSYLRLSPIAKLAGPIRSLLPRLTERMLRAINHFLPPADQSKTASHRGTESFSRWSPSLLTVLTERAARRNNQIHGA